MKPSTLPLGQGTQLAEQIGGVAAVRVTSAFDFCNHRQEVVEGADGRQRLRIACTKHTSCFSEQEGRLDRE